MKKLFLILVLVVAFISIFKVVNNVQNISEKDLIYKNISSLSVDKSTFSFCVLGDNKNSISTFNEIIKKLNDDSSISFVINTGDLVFDGSPIKYSFFLKQVEKLNKPFFVVPGNHDVSDNGVENYIRIFGPLYYSFYVNNSYFIFLNNSNEKNLDLFQLNWLEQELVKSQRFKYRFVFLHVPLFDPRVKTQPGHSMKDLENAHLLLSMFKKYNVTMVFAGHIHGFFKGNWEGVPYIITGGAGAELVGLDKNHYFYHYVKVNVSENEVSYEVIKMDSPDFNVFDRIFAFIWLYLYSFVVINYWVIILLISSFSLGVILFSYDKFRRIVLAFLNRVKKAKIVKFLKSLHEKMKKL
ncbi:metallophosphoesterase family protein [Thermosipho globiformans]|uniref:metallophosphoesterase family protein n=1 Tax=Thermosipho globiformans TaxID=380685 RepID=UPI000F8C69D3|nr:metallophosphoesterase [Thermosipho globiformans]